MLSPGLALHTDKYQINMMYAHWVQGTHNRKAVFEAFFRKLPFGNGYAVFAGLERIVKYVEDLRFEDSDLEYLREQEENYDPAFLEELRNFRFTGTLYSVREGSLVFPGEPLVRVESRIFEAQLIETALLNFMNYQTLIATKASRIRQVAKGDLLMEFGIRRAQEADAALWGTRAVYLAGFDSTSNMLAGKLFGIPTAGTHAHSWVQSHENEEEAFRRYAQALPDQVTLLVDTYDTLGSGVPHAINIGLEMKRQGKSMKAVRLDSGDIAYLSIKTREMLDQAGLSEVKIVASNDLDEHTIQSLKVQGARVDSWGVGTQLITAADQPTLGGVYKLVAREGGDGAYIPTIKISANPEKVTIPGPKNIYRLIDTNTGKAIADYLCYPEETDIGEKAAIKLFHPNHPYISRQVEKYEAESLLIPVFQDGKRVYDLPDLTEIRQYHQKQLRMFWPEYLRMHNPEHYWVHLSEQVWETRANLMKRYTDK
ncbi:nicotinate phosphoribosyltransferase [Brevibacillus ruminantium]|uniref:Nicotinate phosphoribosyltransferase n=1 Tax=Brevibacillus ruminantium TaxID=2950604 RepID=A0ABY4WCK7_9BACL|nr:nicotinate phosphoribosyltransferase [Brevibacillus ruminantium]USG64905.1 nicotinate phosphoribosyltransferase [Brevibacillus ruminantium]